MYRVIYEIDIDAKSPLEAALTTETILNNMNYRPYFKVIDLDNFCTTVGIDLEQDPVVIEEIHE